MNEKYAPPVNAEFQINHFKASKKTKKSLLQFIAFDKEKRIFFNIEILGTNGILCASCDGIPMFRYDNKKSPYFIDSQWIIDEKIGGKNVWCEVKRLVEELKSNKSLWEYDRSKYPRIND